MTVRPGRAWARTTPLAGRLSADGAVRLRPQRLPAVQFGPEQASELARSLIKLSQKLLRFLLERSVVWRPE